MDNSNSSEKIFTKENQRSAASLDKQPSEAIQVSASSIQGRSSEPVRLVPKESSDVFGSPDVSPTPSSEVSIDNTEINEINAFLKKIGLKYQISNDNIDIEKLFKIRCLYHKLLSDSILNNKNDQTPKTFKNATTNFVEDETFKNSIKVPSYKFIECLSTKVQAKINQKIKMSSYQRLHADFLFNYRKNYTNFHLVNYAKDFFQKFFNNQNITISDYYIEIDSKDILTIKNFENVSIENDVLKSDILSIKSRFILIYLTIPEHANSIIIDTLEKKIYHFEPNSYNFLLKYNNNHILLKKWLYMDNLLTDKIINSFITNTVFSPQEIDIIINKYFVIQTKTDTILKFKLIATDNATSYFTNMDENIKKIYNIKNIRFYFNAENKNFVLWIIDIISNQHSNNLTLNQDEYHNEDIKIDIKKNFKPFIYDKILYEIFKRITPNYKYNSAYSCTRTDLPIIKYEVQSGFDPDGYCNTINYFFWFLLLLNSDQLDNIPLSLFMSKWVFKYDTIMENNNNISTNFVRKFATIIFQYYNKCVYTYLDKIINENKTIDFKIDDEQEKKIKILLRNILYKKDINSAAETDILQIEKDKIQKNYKDEQKRLQELKKTNFDKIIADRKKEYEETNQIHKKEYIDAERKRSEEYKQAKNNLNITLNNLQNEYAKTKLINDLQNEYTKTKLINDLQNLNNYVKIYNDKNKILTDEYNNNNNLFNVKYNIRNKELLDAYNNENEELVAAYNNSELTDAFNDDNTVLLNKVKQYLNSQKTKSDELSKEYTVDEQMVLNEYDEKLNNLENPNSEYYKQVLNHQTMFQKLLKMVYNDKQLYENEIKELLDTYNKNLKDLNNPDSDYYKKVFDKLIKQNKKEELKIQQEYNKYFSDVKSIIYTFQNNIINIFTVKINDEQIELNISESADYNNLFLIFLYTEIITNQDFQNFQKENCLNTTSKTFTQGNEFKKNLDECIKVPTNIFTNKYLKYKIKYLNLKKNI
uniref:Uncharacterized protein n=1 Tax=viral metagenome TaxID=1070528 RepID=A0A6C0EFM8_9ZZZZ